VTAEIGMQILEKVPDLLASQMKRVAAANIPIPAGHLERFVLPQPQDIADAVGDVLGIKEKLSLSGETPKSSFKVV
jgi:pyruvate/2-oxoglutarate/acetoin dehydrogenase E1 component